MALSHSQKDRSKITGKISYEDDGLIFNLIDDIHAFLGTSQ